MCVQCTVDFFSSTVHGMEWTVQQYCLFPVLQRSDRYRPKIWVINQASDGLRVQTSVRSTLMPVHRKSARGKVVLTGALAIPFLVSSPNRIIRGNTKRSTTSTWTFCDFDFKNVITGGKACVRSDHLGSAVGFKNM